MQQTNQPDQSFINYRKKEEENKMFNLDSLFSGSSGSSSCFDSSSDNDSFKTICEEFGEMLGGEWGKSSCGGFADALKNSGFSIFK